MAPPAVFSRDAAQPASRGTIVIFIFPQWPIHAAQDVEPYKVRRRSTIAYWRESSSLCGQGKKTDLSPRRLVGRADQQIEPNNNACIAN